MTLAMNTAMLLHTTGVVHPIGTVVPQPVPTPNPAPVAESPVRQTPMIYTVQRSTVMATVNPAVLQWRNPVLGRWATLSPQARSSFSLPTLISPVSTPVDTTLFEEPQNAALEHCLPGYTLATQGSGGSLVKWASFAPSAQGFMLTAHLAKTPVPNGTTEIVPTTVRYMLTGVDGGQNVSWDFSSVTTDATTLTLALTVTAIGDRDSIYRVLTTPSSNCKLVLRRSFAVASYIAPTASAPAPLYQAGTPAIDTAIPFIFDINLDRNVFSQLSGVSGGTTGLNPYHVSWQQRSYPYYQDPNEPTQIYFLPDGFKISRRNNAPHAPSISIASSGSDPSSQVYVLSFLAVPVWDLNRIQNAATNLANTLALGSTPTLTPFEATNTSLALNLPAADSTVTGLAPVSGATIDVGAGVSASVTLTLSQLQQVYSALFDDVSQLLSGIVTVTVGAGATADVVKLPLSARASDFSGNLFDIVSTVDSTFHRITQTLTNAIESPIQVQALTGTLIRADQTTIPSVAQQAWPVLPITLPPITVQTTGSTTPSDSSSTATGISPTSPTSPTSPATSDSSVVAGAVGTVAQQASGATGNAGGGFGSILSGILSGFEASTGPSAGPPPQVPANGMAYAIAVASGTPLDNTCIIAYDFSNTHVQADANAIWDAIMQNQVLSPIARTVEVLVFASLFNPPTTVSSTTSTDSSSTSTPAPVSSQLRAIQVIFEDGQTANFDASTPATAGILNQTVSLSIPIKAFVLHEGDTSTYRYRVNSIRDSGSQISDWVSSNQDSFYVEVGS